MWKVRLFGEGGVRNRKKDESIKPEIGAWPKNPLRFFFFLPVSKMVSRLLPAIGS
jgi:hypothetical protein